MNKFKVGQELVCVEQTGFLVEGEVYTVREDYENGVSVNECDNKRGYACYSNHRFIPNSIELTLEWDDINSFDVAYDLSDDIGKSFLSSIKSQIDTITDGY
jgi:hypothetical protein